MSIGGVVLHEVHAGLPCEETEEHSADQQRAEQEKNKTLTQEELPCRLSGGGNAGAPSGEPEDTNIPLTDSSFTRLSRWSRAVPDGLAGGFVFDGGGEGGVSFILKQEGQRRRHRV